MIKREFNARMVDDFKAAWISACAADEAATFDQIIEWYSGLELESLAERVSGQVVTLTENEYPVGENDFFEKEDNNFVIFPCLFEETK